MSNSSILPIDKTLSGATTQDRRETGSDENEGTLHIPQISSITGASSWDCFVGGWCHPSAEMQSEYSTTAAYWASHTINLAQSEPIFHGSEELLLRSSELQPNKRYSFVPYPGH